MNPLDPQDKLTNNSAIPSGNTPPSVGNDGIQINGVDSSANTEDVTLPGQEVAPTPKEPTPIVNDVMPTAPVEESSEAIAKGKLATLEVADDASTEGARVLKEKAKATSFKQEALPNFHIGEGINLIPTKTEDEIKLEQRKSGFNLLSAIAILLLIVITLSILGYNILTKLQLNRAQNRLNATEQELMQHAEIIRANNDILNRFQLYTDIQESTFSPREVLLYWQNLFSGFGTVNNIEIKNGLNFEVDGSTKSLTDVAFLWHILTVDDKVSTMNLNSMSKGREQSRFSFEGELDFEYFLNQESELNDGSNE